MPERLREELANTTFSRSILLLSFNSGIIMSKPLISITMGDPAGIGPEVILKTLVSARARATANMTVVGYPEPFERDMKLTGIDLAINEIEHPADAVDDPDTLNLLIPGTHSESALVYGAVDERCGRATGHCIEHSAQLALDREIDAIVTAPINKESLNAAGFHYPGHTEFYQHLTGAADIGMMLTLGNFRVIHVTTHVAIREVPELVKKARIVRVATLIHEALVLLGMENPKLAVSGLNPHAGEAGMFGKEEIAEIIPAVKTLNDNGINAVGPLPPDTVFARAYCGEFDAVIAMFHDQGHIALKLAGFTFGEDSREIGGVNTTLGLPIIRSSVDHGTAFDIAGKGIASPLSMIEAVEMAAALAKGKRIR